MNEKSRKHRDFLQNVFITLLSVSAVFLFAQTQLYTLGSGSSYFSFLSDSDSPASTAAPVQTTALTAPVRVAIAGTYGRYGSVTLSTAEEAFAPFDSLLGEALTSAGTYSASNKQQFLNALQGTSVYYDFLSSLPLSVLGAFISATGPDDVFARHLVIADDKGSVSLYLWDGGSNYLHCSTTLLQEELTKAVERYELENAVFAFEQAEADPNARNLVPCSLFLVETPQLPTLNETIPPIDTNHLLTALQFNPYTQFRNTESSGTEVIVENNRSLRISPDGSIYYQSGSDPVLAIDSMDTLPTHREAAAGAGALLNALTGSSTGEAALYLHSIQQTDTVTTMTFDYQSNGIPICFSDGSSAATIILSGNTVSSLSLRIREYTAAGTNSMLLPLRQVLAIAEQYGHADLSIGYAENGSGTLSATWLAE